MGFELRGKKILVTGATGFIGSFVTRRLLREGARVRILVRTLPQAEAFATEDVEVFEGDMRDAGSLRRAVEGCQVVFHFAAVMGDAYQPYTYFREVNVEGTRLLAESALEMQIERFIHTSTVSVYGHNAGRDTDEESSLPQSDEPYGDTKLQAEMIIRGLVQNKGLPAVIVQPSQVYGPGDKTWTLRPLQLIQSRKMILPDGGSGLIHPIYIDDLVDGILATTLRGTAGEAYILCGPERVTIREFFGHLAAIAGKNRLPSVPCWFAISIARTAELVARITRRPPVFTRNAIRFVTGQTTFNGSKASRDLGFCPATTLESGMRSVEDWLLREGYLA